MSEHLIPTKYSILHPEGTVTNGMVEWPQDPGYDRIRELYVTVLGEESYAERVVYRKADGGVADMLVDDEGHLKGLKYNPEATAHYRRDWCIKNPGQNPDCLHHIVGLAIVFDRKIWF